MSFINTPFIAVKFTVLVSVFTFILWCFMNRHGFNRHLRVI